MENNSSSENFKIAFELQDIVVVKIFFLRPAKKIGWGKLRHAIVFIPLADKKS